MIVHPRLDVMREHAMQLNLKGELRVQSNIDDISKHTYSYHQQSSRFQRMFPFHVVLTERARLDMVRGSNLAPERIVVAHHSMDVDKFADSALAGTGFRATHGIPGEGVVVFGFASLLQDAKGVELLIKAAPAIVALAPVRPHTCVLVHAPTCVRKGACLHVLRVHACVCLCGCVCV